MNISNFSKMKHWNDANRTKRDRYQDGNAAHLTTEAMTINRQMVLILYSFLKWDVPVLSLISECNAFQKLQSKHIYTKRIVACDVLLERNTIKPVLRIVPSKSRMTQETSLLKGFAIDIARVYIPDQIKV